MTALNEFISIKEQLKDLAKNNNLHIQYHIDISNNTIYINPYIKIELNEYYEDVTAVKVNQLTESLKTILEDKFQFAIISPNSIQSVEYDYDMDDDIYEYTIVEDYVFYQSEFVPTNIQFTYKEPSVNDDCIEITITPNGSLEYTFQQNIQPQTNEFCDIINGLLETQYKPTDSQKQKEEAYKQIMLLKETLPKARKLGETLLKDQDYATITPYFTFSHEFIDGVAQNLTNLVLKLNTTTPQYKEINNNTNYKPLEKAYPGCVLINSMNGFDLPTSQNHIPTWTKTRHFLTSIRYWNDKTINHNAMIDRVFKDIFDIDILHKYHTSSSGVKIQIALTSKRIHTIKITETFDRDILGLSKSGDLVMYIQNTTPVNPDLLKNRVNQFLDDIRA